MSLAIDLHEIIEKCNFLKPATEEYIYPYLLKHPDLYKSLLLVDHAVRSFAMIGLNAILPFSELANLGICFFGSLFYRLTAENTCAYKFALPSFFGSIAMPLAYSALLDLISGVALASLSAFALALVSMVPLVAYVVYIVLTVSYDVDAEIMRKCPCHDNAV